MSELTNLNKPIIFSTLRQRIVQYLERTARSFDRKAMNPPRERCWHPADIPDEWVSVGYIPCPQTRLGWFTYHAIHGLAMRYPWRAVLAFARLHSHPNRGKENKADG
ncbi:MAG: hypothetical protein KF832_29985 [Caldilineaceae bacterium]|nr:hypothetical protein [Caldilineaceae bacterium]